MIKDESKKRGAEARAARLEVELRANLKKRKQQAKARTRDAGEPPPADGSSPADEGK